MAKTPKKMVGMRSRPKSKIKKMVSVPLTARKEIKRPVGIKTIRKPLRKCSDEELARLKHNLRTLWSAFKTPEIKEALSKNNNARFLRAESGSVNFTLSFVDRGILLDYELDLGSKKDLGGARMYKQDETALNRYCTIENGAEELLATANVALQSLTDVLIDKELSEAEILNAVIKREQIHISAELPV